MFINPNKEQGNSLARSPRGVLGWRRYGGRALPLKGNCSRRSVGQTSGLPVRRASGPKFRPPQGRGAGGSVNRQTRRSAPHLNSCFERLAIESGLGLGSVFVKQVQEELVCLEALAAGGFKEAAQHTVVLQAFLRAGALDDFAHDDDRTQTALGLVIGRRYAGPPICRRYGTAPGGTRVLVT
jgi:hypothetical protein